MGRDVLVALVRIYRMGISPFLPNACRFYPSCSVYAEQAIRKHGVLKGIAFGVGRVGRCHPWDPGGYDPVK